MTRNHTAIGFWVSAFLLLPTLAPTAIAAQFTEGWNEFFAPDGMSRKRTLIGEEFLKLPPGEQFSFVAGVLDGLAVSGDKTVLKCLSQEPVPTDIVEVTHRVKGMLGNVSWQDSPVAVYIQGAFEMACKGKTPDVKINADKQNDLAQNFINELGLDGLPNKEVIFESIPPKSSVNPQGGNTSNPTTLIR